MLPLNFLQSKLNDMWKTHNGDRDYKHIVIYRKDGKYYLRTNVDNKEHYDDLTDYIV